MQDRPSCHGITSAGFYGLNALLILQPTPLKIADATKPFVVSNSFLLFCGLKEKERRQRSRLTVRSESRLKTFSHHRNSNDDNDDDNVPPGGMNGGFGSFHNGPRVVF